MCPNVLTQYSGKKKKKTMVFGWNAMYKKKIYFTCMIINSVVFFSELFGAAQVLCSRVRVHKKRNIHLLVPVIKGWLSFK